MRSTFCLACNYTQAHAHYSPGAWSEEPGLCISNVNIHMHKETKQTASFRLVKASFDHPDRGGIRYMGRLWSLLASVLQSQCQSIIHMEIKTNDGEKICSMVIRPSSCNIWSPQSKQKPSHPHTIKRICNVLCEFLCAHCVFYKGVLYLSSWWFIMTPSFCLMHTHHRRSMFLCVCVCVVIDPLWHSQWEGVSCDSFLPLSSVLKWTFAIQTHTDTHVSVHSQLLWLSE